MGGINLLVQLEIRDGATVFSVRPEWNPPGTGAALGELLGRGVTPFQVDFCYDKYSESAARISWLRSAYLVMFAIFGYNVVFAASMQIVRQQIENPKQQLIKLFSIVVPEKVPLTTRRIMKTHTPAWLNCWAVQVGNHCVFLPEPNDQTLYSRVAGNRGTEAQTITGRPIEWPREPFAGL